MRNSETATREQPQFAATREKACIETKSLHSQKKERKFRSFKKIKLLGRGEIANTVAGRAEQPGTNILLCSPPP